MEGHGRRMKHRVFYGWIIVAAGMGVMATAIGIVNNCFGLLIVPACNELGFSRQAMAGNQTMLNLGAMLTAMAWGRVFSRFRLKRLMCIGSVLMCALYFLFALVRSLTGFYLVALTVGLAQGMINVMPFSIVIGNWFNEKRGLALGLTYMGSGIGGMLFNAIGGRLVESLGWRHTVLVFGIILCVIILPLVFLLVKTSPEEMGLRPLGKNVALTSPATGKSATQSRFRQYAVIIVGLEIMIAGMAVNGIAATSTPYYTDLFASGVVGANLASGFMASLAVGKLVLGVFYDKLGVFRATLISRALLLLALLALALGSNPICIALFLLCAGIAAAANSVAIPFLARTVAADRTVTGVVGAYSGLQSLGALLAPVVCGWICDYMGSYSHAYVLLLFGIALMLAPLLLCLHRNGDREALKCS